jgi:hypothetical protein
MSKYLVRLGMERFFHFFLAILPLQFAYVVFRPIFRRDYTA